MIELQNVSKFYTTNGVVSSGLHNISLKLSKNEIVAITGESGSGKSTLLNVITKMDTFDEGEYYYKGNETSYFNIDDMDQFRKNKIGFIFQNYNIIDSYTVLENVMLPMILNGINKKDAKLRALELIEKVGLINRKFHRGTKLSGGEKQRCVIARALASDCEILACDEPTGNLDSKTGEEIIKLIKEVSKDKLVLIVTHNFEQVEGIVTRKLKISDGDLVEDKIIEEHSDTETENLDLDYIPLKRKIDASISRNNLLFTPRKTFFVGLVLLVVAFFALTLYQVCYNVQADFYYYNDLNYSGNNKIIAYNNGNPLDKDKLSKEFGDNIYYNEFYQTYNDSMSFYNDDYIINANYEDIISKYEILYGREVQNEDEALLVLPNNDTYTVTNYKPYLNQDLSYFSYNLKYDETINPTFKIVGIAYSSDVLNVTLTSNSKLRVLFHNYYFNDIKIDYYCSTDNSDSTSNYFSIKFVETGKNRFIVSNKYNSITFTDSIRYGDYEFNPENIDISYEESVYNVILLVSLEDELFTEEAYEAVIYGNQDKIINKLNDMDIKHINVKTYNTLSSLETFINNIVAYFTMLIASFAIVVIYFISYVVLAKVYSSKKKDYNILRTLGVTKKDMSRIVKYEVMFETIIISILVYIVLFILGKTGLNDFTNLFKNITFVSSLIYFIVMFLFGYFIARRFNRKLFKFSVNATFKNGVTKND